MIGIKTFVVPLTKKILCQDQEHGDRYEIVSLGQVLFNFLKQLGGPTFRQPGASQLRKLGGVEPIILGGLGQWVNR